MTFHREKSRNFVQCYFKELLGNTENYKLAPFPLIQYWLEIRVKANS